MRVTGAWSKTVLIATLAVIAGAAQAAPITEITGSPSISNPVDVETTLTSITTEADGTFDQLIGPASVVLGDSSNSYFWQANGGTFDNAVDDKVVLLEGLSLTTAIANTSFQATFTDPRVTTETLFFIFEIGASDDFTIAPIDDEGNTLGTWSLTRGGGAAYGPDVIETTDVEKSTGGTTGHDIGGFTFSLNEFTGEGDLTGFAGFDIDGDTDGADPVLFGAVVPEPTTLAISALGLVGLVRRRRR